MLHADRPPRDEVYTPPGPSDLLIERIEDAKEKRSTRKFIAVGLLFLVAILLIILLLGALFHRWEAKDTVDLSSAIITPVIGIFGMVMGFYFGDRQR